MRLLHLQLRTTTTLQLSIMPRVKRGLHHNKRRKNILRHVKGFERGRKNLLKLAKTAATKAGAYAYSDRRKKKRTTRQLWQVQVNAGSRALGVSYSVFINQLKKQMVALNRKMLSKLAQKNPVVFAKIVKAVQLVENS